MTFQCILWSRRKRSTCLGPKSLDTGFVCFHLNCDGMEYFDLSLKQRFFFSLKNQSITMGNLCMGLYDYEHRHMYNKFQHVFYCCTILLTNNSMSLGNGKYFLSMVCKRQGSDIVLVLLATVSSWVLCLIFLDRTCDSPSHLGRNRPLMRHHRNSICHLSVD